MKKTTLTLLLICMTSGLAFGQAQSLSLSGPSVWTPGTQITLNVALTFTGYSAEGLIYWLEVPNAVAPFLSITNAQYFTFLDPNNAFGFPVTFTDTFGARAGYRDTNRDLGATTDPGPGIAPGTYPVTTLTFLLASGAPLGTYTMYSTSIAPRISNIRESVPNFGDEHLIVPPGAFAFTIVPEPSTLALLGVGVLGLGLIVYRRKSLS